MATVGSAATEEPPVFTRWETVATTALGLLVLCLIAVGINPLVAAAVWLIATVPWFVNLVFSPSGMARVSARKRGLLATLCWAPLAGPFSIGVFLRGLLDLLGSFNF